MDERNERGTRKSHAPEVRTTGARAGGKGEASHDQRSGEAPTTSGEDERSRSDHRLMEQVVERVNALAALKRVKQNKGSPGADGMSVDDLTPYLALHWEAIRAQLLAGSYQPQPVKRQEIPKPGGARGISASRRCWIGSSSSACCRYCNRSSTRRSPTTATASDRGAARTMRCERRSSTSSRGGAGWPTWTWQSSLIG